MLNKGRILSISLKLLFMSKKTIKTINKKQAKIKELVKKGLSQTAIAKKLKVSRTCVRYWINK